MITLSEEQRKKIEENKAAAILRKQQAIQKQNEKSPPVNLTKTQYPWWREKGIKKNSKKSPIRVRQNKNISSLISATCKVYGESRFLIEIPYHGASIEVFKSINGRKYEPDLRKWSFPFSEQSALLQKLKHACPEIVVDAIPASVIKVLAEPDPAEPTSVNWSKIDKTLRNYLMPFQVDGVKFGIQKEGKCLIADDMGLGKTIQALGIAHYFRENWPLLIVCPSSMRFPWQEAIRTFLPSVQVEVQVLTSGKGQPVQGDIVISSYDLMKNCFEDLRKKNFGAIIFDESHSLKSPKAQRTKTALQLSRTAKNVILLTGTPALSRPEELYSQIFAIDPHTFRTMYDFGMRYCNGRKDRFGWNFSGSSNLEELEMYLKKKLMIRRLKSEVLQQLPSKMRKVVILSPSVVKEMTKRLRKLESKFENQEGAAKHSTLLSYYSYTGTVKLQAVCEYIEDKLQSEKKFLIFAHHVHMIKGICDLLDRKNVRHIKIDGSVSSEARKVYCDEFQNEDSCRVAVLSITAANCGITLTAAHLVMFAELYWNPGELTQAEDRAHRIGQQDSVFVEYLVAKGTADDYLWKLVNKKFNILNRAGLCKDNFKETDTEHLNDPNQPKITSLLQGNNKNKSPDNATGNKVWESEADDELFLMEDEDDIFTNINLEEIENEYQLNNKKRKASEEDMDTY